MQIKSGATSLALALALSLALSLAVPTAGPALGVPPTPARDTAVVRAGATDFVARHRPGATRKSCTRHLCVRWTPTGQHAPAAADRNKNKVPDFVDKVRTTVEAIHLRYRKAGYLSPLPDHKVGGDDRTDIYLRDVGARGSRCYTDNPQVPLPATTWAYCVLDNDFARSQFTTGTPVANLKVTAAHEYFHAVQMAYDAHEDGWLWESTATWAADQLFPSLARRLQYVGESPMTDSLTPLDSYLGQQHGFAAGASIFWRYLAQHYPAAEGGMPTLVRNVWRRLDVRARTGDDYALQGLETVLGERSTNLTEQLAFFADANRHPADADSYTDGDVYPVADPGVSRLLTEAHPGPITDSKALRHLTSYTVRYVPHTTLDEADWKLTLVLDLPDAASKPAAVVTRYLQDGTTLTQRVALGATGGGSITVPFSVGALRYVEVTLVNASDRITSCGSDDELPVVSCFGKATDDGLVASVTATAARPAPAPRH